MPFRDQASLISIFRTIPLLAVLFTLMGSALGQDSPESSAKSVPASVEKMGTIILKGEITDVTGKGSENKSIDILLVPYLSARPQDFCSDCFRKPVCKRDCKSCCPRARVVTVTTDSLGKYVVKFESVEPAKYVLINLQGGFSGGLEKVITVAPGATEKAETSLVVSSSVFSLNEHGAAAVVP